MNKLQQANEKSIVDYLIKEGLDPIPKGSKVWFFSPFHSESVESFCVDERNRWKDYSVFPDMMWGSAVDFVRAYKEVKYNEAVRILLEGELVKHEVRPRDPKPYFEIVGEEELSNRRLTYLSSRKIDLTLAKKYCTQLIVKYPKSRKPDNTYKLIGFKNNNGGYEVRMKYPYMDVKSTLIPNGITTIKGGQKELIFEGFFNFLSYVTIFGDTDRTVYVLNSTGNWKWVPVLVDAEYWGDNGCHYNTVLKRYVYPGDEVLRKLKGRITDMRYKYRPWEDLNDYLVKPWLFTKNYMI